MNRRVVDKICRAVKKLRLSNKKFLCLDTSRRSFTPRRQKGLEVPKAAKSTGDRHRDLNAYERSLLALKIKPDIAAKAKENMLATQNNNAASACQKSDKQIDTKKEVAKLAGVSHDTIAKVEKIEKHATPEVKAAVQKAIATAQDKS